ncbi:hypothetical protein [uncultured Sphaerotilus sp.]|uniref:hypothetical protein n=1 Tax=uncultured Sphaerotilus sp. TaxID=474984 RepID=UPI0030CA1355
MFHAASVPQGRRRPSFKNISIIRGALDRFAQVSTIEAVLAGPVDRCRGAVKL